MRSRFGGKNEKRPAELTKYMKSCGNTPTCVFREGTGLKK